MKAIQIYQVKRFGKPIGQPDPRIGETNLAHSDMLRYDLAFCDPDNPSLVIFPRFKGKDGASGGRITHERWSSFLMTLTPWEGEELHSAFGRWISYRNDPDSITTRQMSLDEYLRLHKLKLA